MRFHNFKILPKNSKLTVIFTVLILSFSCSKNEKSEFQSFSLNKNWTFQSDSMDKALDAVVPGNYTIDLLRHKIIENPYLKDNIKHTKTGRENVVYRCTFNSPES